MSLASIMWRAISATVYISKETIGIFHHRLTCTVQHVTIFVYHQTMQYTVHTVHHNNKILTVDSWESPT